MGSALLPARLFAAAAAALLLAGGVAGGAAPARPAPPPGMAAVGPGILKLLDPPSDALSEARVPRFFLDKTPVTNAQYLAFVTSSPEWGRAQVPRLLADAHYLAHWEGPLTLGAKADPSGPVVHVSWFSAKAYCQARGARLPTESEWELAAMASETQAAPLSDPRRDELILSWYSRPTPARMPPVGKGRPNFWGVHDLHGLVWEWVHDFNSRVVSDGRRTDEAFVCGGGSLRGADKTNYAAFMRMALRASLRGSYTTADLGFRCASSEKVGKP